MSQKMPIEEFWKYAPDWVNFVAEDANGFVYGYAEDPYMREKSWDSADAADKIQLLLDLGDDWTESKRERPVDYAGMVGMFGKFWDSGEELPDERSRYGYLLGVRERALWPFEASDGVTFCRFRPMVPAARIEVKP